MSETHPRFRCVVLGAGGHARVLVDCLQSPGVADLVGVLDPDPRLHRQKLLGIPILGGDDLLAGLAVDGVTHFVVGLGGVGNNGPRRRLFELGCSAGLDPMEVRHGSALVSRWAEVGVGCQFLPGSIVNASAILGCNVIVNSGAIVEHDCIVGDHVHIATGARLASSVKIGSSAHVGAGATVRQCIVIGEGAIVGAGAVVVRNVAPGVVVAGVPARPIGARE